MKQTLIREYFEKNNGILNILPTFVPRRFCKAGHRLRLHPDDYFALGTHRGAIKERWFSSVICAMNGPDAAPDEGMSYVDMGDAEKISLKDFVTELGAELIGTELMEKYGTWPMYSKFFDYEIPCSITSIWTSTPPPVWASWASPRPTTTRPSTTPSPAISPIPTSASIPT